jgi:hypothetical protein
VPLFVRSNSVFSSRRGVEHQLAADLADSRLSSAQLPGPQPQPGPVGLRQSFRVRSQVGHRVVEVENTRRSLMLSNLEQKPVNDLICQPLGQEERSLAEPRPQQCSIVRVYRHPRQFLESISMFLPVLPCLAGEGRDPVQKEALAIRVV